jgi:hypothetical protein
MANRVHAAVYGQKPAVLQSVPDGPRGEAELEQLPTRDYTVLKLRKCRDRPLKRSRL